MRQAFRVHACLLSVDLQLTGCRSLKEKRAVVRHLVDTARRRFGVAAAETGHLQKWQRAELGFAAVGAGPDHVEEVLTSVERFVWSHPEVVVLEVQRRWVTSNEG